jgi:excisionase family DNA binding protein
MNSPRLDGLRSFLKSLPPLLRYDDVATLVCVDVRTIKRWAASGRLTKIRLGGRSLIVRESVEQVLLAPFQPPLTTP